MNTKNLNIEKLKIEIITTFKLGIQLKDFEYINESMNLFLKNKKLLDFYFCFQILELLRKIQNINLNE